MRLGQEHRGDQVGLGAGERRELGAEIRIAGMVRRPRAVERELRRQRGARVKSEPSRLQRVVRTERIPALEDLDELQSQVARAQRRQPQAHRLAVERMRQPDLLAVA